MTASALYAGRVAHRRLRPREHRLHYRVFSLLLDLDEIDALDRRLRLFSRNRFNLFSFRDRDYAGQSDVPLRMQVERLLAAAGIETAGGAIRVFSMPRILGYAFNPLTTWFCHHADGRLVAILYEVHNTFGERHSYLIPVEGEGPIRQHCDKAFYVSPFMDMAMSYEFRVVPPGERIAIAITGSDAEGPLLTASLHGERQALTDGALLRAAVMFPLLTLKVMAGIHYEAALLWMKGVRLRIRPPAPDVEVTVVRPGTPDNAA